MRRRLYSRGMDGVLAEEAAGQSRWFLQDQSGTVRALLSTAGTVLTNYAYDSFGGLASNVTVIPENALRFAAREYDAEVGIGYFRARYYGPTLGRFLQEDPKGTRSYVYAQNAPGVFVDPDGRLAIVERVVNFIKSIIPSRAVQAAGRCAALSVLAVGVTISAPEVVISAAATGAPTAAEIVQAFVIAERQLKSVRAAEIASQAQAALRGCATAARL